MTMNYFTRLLSLVLAGALAFPSPALGISRRGTPRPLAEGQALPASAAQLVDSSTLRAPAAAHDPVDTDGQIQEELVARTHPIATRATPLARAALVFFALHLAAPLLHAVAPALAGENLREVGGHGALRVVGPWLGVALGAGALAAAVIVSRRWRVRWAASQYVKRERLAEAAAQEPGKQPWQPSIDSYQPSFPAVSWQRSLEHTIFDSWSGSKVFHIPLTYSDHQLLALLGALVAVGIGIFLGAAMGFALSCSTSFPWGRPFTAGAIVGSGMFLLSWFAFAVPHDREARDGWAVVRNAKRYLAHPRQTTFDDALLRIARKFEEETHWRIAWTEQPWLLAAVDQNAQRVLMSIGWVVTSPRPADRRRLAYLTQTLRIIRHVIEASSEPPPAGPTTSPAPMLPLPGPTPAALGGTDQVERTVESLDASAGDV